MDAIERIAGLAVFVTGAFGFYRYKRKLWIEQLVDNQDIELWRDKLQDSSRTSQYLKTLDYSLKKLDSFFGADAFGWKSFGMCYLIASVYPILVVIFWWVLSGYSQFGVIQLLPEGWGLSYRLCFLLGSIVFFYSLFLVLNKKERINRYLLLLEGKLTKRISQKVSSNMKILGLKSLVGGVTFGVLFLMTKSIAFSFAGAIAGAIAFSSVISFALLGTGAAIVAFGVNFIAGSVIAFLGAFYFAITFIFAISRIRALIISVSMAFVIMLVSAGWSGIILQEYVAVVIFAVLLPIANGLFDFLSWGISRILGRHLLRHPDKYHAVFLVVIDILSAVLLLTGLIVALVLLVEILNVIASAQVQSEVMDLESQIVTAIDLPFGQGLWITVMLVSTLIPTFLHACIAAVSYLMTKTKLKARRNWIAEIQKVIDGTKEHLSKKETGDIAYYWFFHRHFFPFTLAILVFSVTAWGVDLIHLPDILRKVADSTRTLILVGN